MEAGAGLRAGFPDSEYTDKGVRIANSRAEVFQSADVVVQVRSLGANPETGAATWRCCGQGRRSSGSASRSPPWMRRVRSPSARELPSHGVDAADYARQSMDALSSMATVAGYKAVLLAADALPACPQCS